MVAETETETLNETLNERTKMIWSQILTWKIVTASHCWSSCCGCLTGSENSCANASCCGYEGKGFSCRSLCLLPLPS